jgi:hypothetical protein
MPQLALPDNQDAPFLPPKLTLNDLIPLDVVREFLVPELCSGLGQIREFTPAVPMPEAPVHENNDSPPI